jgi:hypothetical protein
VLGRACSANEEQDRAYVIGRKTGKKETSRKTKT